MTVFCSRVLTSLGLGISMVSAAASQQPTRVVRGGALISSDLPALRIQPDSAFRFVGLVPFRVRDVAIGERYIFVDARDGHVRRLLIAQFESILPTSSERYNYSFREAQVVAGYRFRTNPYAFSQAAARAANPAGEAALTSAFLEQKGYRIDDELMSMRYLTVPDTARKHELIIFYLEALSRSSVRLRDLYDSSGNATPLWIALATTLRARADAAFAVSPLPG